MPRIDLDIIAVIPRLRVWAQGHPNIRRVWLYGSRVKGTQRPDSDLDIAIDIDNIGRNEIDYAKVWGKELDNVVRRWPVHVEMYATPGVDEYVAESGHLIYIGFALETVSD